MAATINISDNYKGSDTTNVQKLKDEAKTKIKEIIFKIAEQICNYFMSRDISSSSSSSCNIMCLQDNLDNTHDNEQVELMITVAYRNWIINTNKKCNYVPECISFRNDPKKVGESKGSHSSFKRYFWDLIKERKELILPFEHFNIEKCPNNLQILIIYPKVKFHYYYYNYYYY